MILDRLTEKATALLNMISHREKLTAKDLIDLITETGGMGKYLHEAVSPHDIKLLLRINTEQLIKEAYLQAIRLEHTYIGTEHLYLALLKIAKSKSQDRAKIELIKRGVFPSAYYQSTEVSKRTPFLDAFGEDLNQRALRNYSTTLIYREEYEKVISILLLRDKSNVLLVGEPGVGKETLIELVAHNINSLNVPPSLVGYTLRSINLLNFMTGVVNKGGLELGIAALVDELKSLNRVILVLDNFQDIFFSSPAGLSIPIFYSILKNNLQDARISVISGLTPSMYDKLTLENEHIIDNFTVVEVEEPNEEEVKEILRVSVGKMEEYHKVQVHEDILDYIYEKASKEVKNLKFPQKAIDLLDYACSYIIAKKSKIPVVYKELVDKSFQLASELDENLSNGEYDKALIIRRKLSKLEVALEVKEKDIFSSKRKIVLSKKDIDAVVYQMDQVDSQDSERKELSKFARVATNMKKEIIGQDEAIELLSRALIRSKLGLRSRKRPLGNFLFLGPTGVGKTETAKVLAKHTFSKDGWQGIIRLDMSDFSEKHTVARLVGAPPGYVGYGEGGELTTKIENHPQSVVLFDEIEKAHPEVLNILLQIMDEGELSDARGNSFDFSKSVVILTSNLGTEILHQHGIGFEEKDIPDSNLEKRLKDNLKKILKPELINRFDEIVVFKRLTKDNQQKILDMHLKEIGQSLRDQKVNLMVPKSVKKWLLAKGYSREFGARELRRTLEKELLDKVAQVILEQPKRPVILSTAVENDTLLVS